MRKYLMLLYFLLFFTNCNNSKKPLNEIPLYDGNKITEIQMKINNDFLKLVKIEIENDKTKYKTFKEASKVFSRRGWELFSERYYPDAIKRFNQAWLLDRENPDVYWGFGIYYGINYSFKKAIEMLEKSLDLENDNIYVMEDLAKSYNMNALFYKRFLNKKEMSRNFNKAHEIINKALNIKETGRLYHHLSVTLFYLKKYKEAYKCIKKASDLGENVPLDFKIKIEKKVKKQNDI